MLEIVATLALLGSAATTADEPVHSKAFWQSVVESEWAVPDGEAPKELLADLFLNLGSPDSELRDDLAYGIAYRWLEKPGLLTADDKEELVEGLVANLERGVGEVGKDTVLLRSFSALVLALFARSDLKEPFLDRTEFDRLLDATIEYSKNERDVRGWDPKLGWLHSAAHTADLFKFLARNEKVTKEQQSRIAVALADKAVTAGEVLRFGEDERLGAAWFSLISREDFDPASIDPFLARLAEGRDQRGTGGFDLARFAARQNGVALLRVLYVGLSTVEDPPERVTAARERLLAELRRY